MALFVESYEEYPFEDLCVYAGIDCVVTSEILAKVFPLIAEQPKYQRSVRGRRRFENAISLLWETTNVKMPAHEFIIDMEINGFKYDIDKNIEMGKAMAAELESLEKTIFTGIGKIINLDSGPEVRAFLYGEMRYEPPGQTKSGDDSVDGDAIRALYRKHGHEWLAAMAKRRDISSVYNSFIKTYVDDWVKSDGRIHPQYNLTGTSSHRISSDSPNLLNLPRMCHSYNIRECYTVETGYVFLALDFSSCEVKILGALSQDPMLLRAIKEGKDFHSFTACLIHDLDYDEYVKIRKDDTHPLHAQYVEMRQQAKAVTFGLLYGSTTGGVAAGLGISVEEAQVIIDAYFKAYPKIKEYIDDAHNMALWNHFVYTPFGQRKQQFGTLPPYKYTAVKNAALRNSQNVLIQSTASTLGLLAFTKLNEEIKKIGGRAICTVYDSVELEIPINRVAEAIEIAYYCMDDWPVEEFSFLDLPIGADAEIGFDWGNIKEVHRGTTQAEVVSILSSLNPQKCEEALAMAA